MHKYCKICQRMLPIYFFSSAKKEKDGLQHRCKACAQAYQKKWRAENIDRVRAHDIERGKAPERKARAQAASRKSYLANKDKVLIRTAAYKKSNPHIGRAAHKKWRERNKPYFAESARKWRERNPEKHIEFTRIRIARCREATPSWANSMAMRNFYIDARRLTKETGIQHHVDHIVPIRSELVCGLHVEHNMQILTARENLSKNNRYWPDMP